MAVSPPGILYCDTYCGNRCTALHFHDGVELVYVVSGNCSNRVPDGEYRASAGQLFVIPSQLPHRQIDRGEVSTFFVVFEGTDESFRSDMRVIDTAGDHLVGEWMRQLEELYRDRRLEEGNLLLALLLRHLIRAEGEASRPSELPETLARAADFLARHFDEPLTLTAVARRFSCSTSGLNALFHRHLQVSPSEFRQRYRLTHARRLLLNSHDSIAEIGSLCGYPTAHYFCRIFRKVYGCTPGEYRKRREEAWGKVAPDEDAILLTAWNRSRGRLDPAEHQLQPPSRRKRQDI